MNTLPLKETALIYLLIILSLSLNDLHFKPAITRDIVTHPWMRFVIIFASAFIIFSMNIDSEYSLGTRIAVAALIALTSHFFIEGATKPAVPLQPMRQ